MPARRTVDPNGVERTTEMVALRLTSSQLETVLKIAKGRDKSVSHILRALIMEEAERIGLSDVEEQAEGHNV
jgi:hypothetical protein